MLNPFNEIINENETDEMVIREILAGDTRALEKLIYRHQAWIYNITLKMVFDSDDAEDLTQEILLKIITHLSSYDPAKAAFRTWLYRITANHVLNMKSRKHETVLTQKHLFDSFTMPEENIADKRPSSRADYPLMVKETRNMCLTGLLLCLERRQRLAFILGGMFEIPSPIGSEIMEISESNYRTLLSRAKKKLGNFVTHKCSLINPENPCRCENHVRKLIATGWIDPENPKLTRDGMKKISSMALERARSVEVDLNSVLNLFRDEPFFDGPDMVPLMKEFMGRDEFMDFFH